MAKYYFCSGFTQASVTVTATFGACSIYREYNDGTCLYQTYSKNISFTFNGAHPALQIWYRYWTEYWDNGTLVYENYQKSVENVPAHSGAHTHTFQQDCHEHRYCNFSGSGNGTNPPYQQMQQ
jgi:hypothetical protein